MKKTLTFLFSSLADLLIFVYFFPFPHNLQGSRQRKAEFEVACSGKNLGNPAWRNSSD